MKVLVGIVVGGMLLLMVIGLLVMVTRFLLSVVGLGPWACSKGFHWWRSFPIHTAQGFGSRTTTYLSYQGVKIEQCRTCERTQPEPGTAIVAAWRSGQLEVVGGGLFSSPKGVRLKDRV